MDTKYLWQEGRRESLVIYGLASIAVLGVVFFLGEEVARNLHDFEQWLAALGPWALGVAVLGYVVSSTVFVPDTLLGMLAGATFGFPGGLAVAAGGSFLGAAVQYVLARRLLKPIISRALVTRPGLAAVQAAVKHQELRLQLLIRLTPVNRALTSYVLGAAGVGFGRFLLACVALAPHLCLEVYFGYAGRHLAKVAGQPTSNGWLDEASVFIGLVAAVVVMVLVARAARRALEAAGVSDSHSPRDP